MMIIEDWLQKEWPFKQNEGDIAIRLSGKQYIATITYFVFQKDGRGAWVADWAVGTTPDEAFYDLWQKVLVTTSELKRTRKLPPHLIDWACRFLGEES